MQLQFPPRVRRLDQLSRGLMLEIVQVEKADDPKLYLERRAYLTSSVIPRTVTTRSGFRSTQPTATNSVRESSDAHDGR